MAIQFQNGERFNKFLKDNFYFKDERRQHSNKSSFLIKNRTDFLQQIIKNQFVENITSKLQNKIGNNTSNNINSSEVVYKVSMLIGFYYLSNKISKWYQHF